MAVGEAISVLLDDPTFTSKSEVFRGNVALPPQPASVFPLKGSLFVKLRGIMEGDLVRITISARGQVWKSSFESVDAYNVDLVSK